MDFLESPEQVALADLARSILDGGPDDSGARGTPDVDAPRTLLAALGRADLLGLSVAEQLGGSGAGLLEVCLVLREHGRALRRVPLLESVLLSAAPLAQFGSGSQVERWLPDLLSGSAVGTAAVGPSFGGAQAARPLRAVRTTTGWRLDGVLDLVPWAAAADVIFVASETDDGVVILLVDAGSPGLTALPQQTLGRSGAAQLTFRDVLIGVDHLVAGPETSAEVSGWMSDRLAVGRCAVQLGICESALRLTADYVQQRQQFGKPIGDFQAVRQRLADAYIDTEAIRLTMLQAAWQLSAGFPAGSAISTAKFWAADAGHRVLHSAVHLHGGVGIDEDYPLHRFFAAGMEIRTLLGPTSEAALGVVAGNANSSAAMVLSGRPDTAAPTGTAGVAATASGSAV